MKTKILVLFFIIFSLTASRAYPYWIWTPKNDKWVNPKYAVKPTPKEQYDFAMEFYNGKKFVEARREFKKLVKAYPKSAEAAESQYYLGRVEEALGNLYEAFLAYQKVIDKYPFSERIQEIIEREFAIGDKFMAGEKRKALGVALPVENPAIEIYSKIVENSTYGPLAPKAEYKLGLVLKGLMRYYEAEEAFNKVITAYPESEWTEPAKFQVASCRAALSKGMEYDRGAAEEAKQKFEEFVKEHPDASLSEEAEKNIGVLREKEAESGFNIGRFYEKQGQLEAAKIYYNEVMTNFDTSSWAAKASERLEIVEKMLEKKNAKKKK
jgi:outer membrane protein assembly factor BamD